jgi:hypothetical protein
MTRYLAILAAATMMACSGADKGTGDTGAPPGDDDDDDDVTGCENTATPEFPTQGDADVYYRSSVRFALATADPAATITVSDAGGTEVPGTTTSTDLTVSWSPTDTLTPSTEYTAALSFECGESTVSFTTSSTGLPTDIDPTGSVYALDVANGQWLEPVGVGTILASQLGDTQIFVSVDEVAPTSITMLGAIGSGNAQDLCSPTIPFPPAVYADPYFELQSPLLPLVVAGFVIEIQDLDMSGAISPSADRIQGASLAGSVDTRPLGAAFDLGTEPGAVCEFVATFNVECEPCGGDAAQPYCLSVLVENIGAPAVAGLTLEPREEADIAADPDCQ